ncbi:MAG: NADH:flavin oxidoreductase, partial [Deltaproteobacteria bacterium]
YLLSQFLSPYTNRRRDSYGGTLDGRLGFVREVVSAVKDALGPERALLVKFNLEDGFRGGLQIDEAVVVARAFEKAGADALVPSGGFVSRTPFFMMRGDVPVRQMVRNERRAFRRMGLRVFGRLVVQRYPYRDLFFFDGAKRIVEAVSAPVVLLGGVRTLDQMEQAIKEGFEFVSMARPLIHDPELPSKLESGQASGSGCIPCNLCVAEMERAGIRCPVAEEGRRG